jgi:hypothetical protein
VFAALVGGVLGSSSLLKTDVGTGLVVGFVGSTRGVEVGCDLGMDVAATGILAGPRGAGLV